MSGPDVDGATAPSDEGIALEDIEPGRTLCVLVRGRRPGQRPQYAILSRDEQGRVVAYLNECQHIPVPLGPPHVTLMTPGRQRLMCHTHGAEYRLNDGLCTAGPCTGERLTAIPFEVRQRRVFLGCVGQ